MWFILVLFFSQSLFAQIGVDSATFAKKSEQLDYTKTKTIRVPKESSDLPPQREYEDIDTGFWDGLGDGFSVLGVILVATVLILVLYFVLKDVRVKLKPGETTSIDLDNIDDIELVNFDAMYAAALEAKDYRLALRINFLKIIQKLTNKKELIWRPFKTNRVYANEISSTAYRKPFRRAADVFEHTWYGMSAVTEVEFESYNQEFRQLLKRLENES